MGLLRGNILYVVIRCRDALTSDRRGSGFAEVFRLTLSNTRAGVIFDKKYVAYENHTASYYFHGIFFIFFNTTFYGFTKSCSKCETMLMYAKPNKATKQLIKKFQRTYAISYSPQVRNRTSPNYRKKKQKS